VLTEIEQTNLSLYLTISKFGIS